jgi:hypothetical protein
MPIFSAFCEFAYPVDFLEVRPVNRMSSERKTGGKAVDSVVVILGYQLVIDLYPVTRTAVLVEFPGVDNRDHCSFLGFVLFGLGERLQNIAPGIFPGVFAARRIRGEDLTRKRPKKYQMFAANVACESQRFCPFEQLA